MIPETSSGNRGLLQAEPRCLPLDGGGGREAAGGGVRTTMTNEPKAARRRDLRFTPPQSTLRADSSPIEGEQGSINEVRA